MKVFVQGLIDGYYAMIYNAHVIITPTFQVLFDFYKEGETYNEQ